MLYIAYRASPYIRSTTPLFIQNLHVKAQILMCSPYMQGFACASWSEPFSADPALEILAELSCSSLCLFDAIIELQVMDEKPSIDLLNKKWKWSYIYI